LFRNDFLILKAAIKFKPDIFVSAFIPFPAHVGTLLRKPVIGFTDTEHATLNNLLTKRFADSIFTPTCFNKDFGEKQVRFNGYLELNYLHPNYFKPHPSVLNLLDILENEKFIILRFVSWDAAHDINQSGLDKDARIRLVHELSKNAKVFISSEEELPQDLSKYQITIPPERMHDALAYASLYIGEGATMVSECAMLGTPAIYVNSLSAGTLEEQEKYGLIFSYRDSKGVLEKALELLNTLNLNEEFQKRRQKLLSEKIDVTAFLVWFVENYPESAKIVKQDPDYQLRFR
jgi:hypothetical protein